MTKVMLMSYEEFCYLAGDLIKRYKKGVQKWGSVEEFLDKWFSDYCYAYGIEGIAVDEGDEVVRLMRVSNLISYLARDGWLEDFVDIWKAKKVRREQ
jgi:hypothetical protein